MNCKRSREHISLFLDGMLPPKAQASLNRHMEDCRECSTYLDDIREVLAQLREEALEPPSDNFEWNLRRKLNQAIAHRDFGEEKQPWNWNRFSWAAAASLILVAGLSYWMQPGDYVPGKESGSSLSGRRVNEPAGARVNWARERPRGASSLRPVASERPGRSAAKSEMAGSMVNPQRADTLSQETPDP